MKLCAGKSQSLVKYKQYRPRKLSCDLTKQTVNMSNMAQFSAAQSELKFVQLSVRFQGK